MKSGFVSLIGRPNVGKSTLLNSILNAHVSITSPVAQTTRNVIQGVYNDADTQIVFIDTPGIHKPINKLGKVLNKEAVSLTKDIDVILFLVDAAAGLGTGDRFIIDTFKNTDIPVILVLNKIDELNNEQIVKRIMDYKDLYSFAEFVPISALTNDNVDHLIEVIKKYLTDNVKYFDTDTKTNSSKYFMISEYVREKLMNHLDEEIPHSITCLTTHYDEDDKIIDVGVDIIVDRDSLKKIVIGHDGALLKQVGTEARKDIEELLHKKVFLELYVKTIDNWRDKEKYLHEFGFIDNE
jgi:GTPase